MQNYILADNQELTRLALEQLLRQGGDCHIEQAANVEQLRRLLLRQEGPVVVVLDYTLFDFADVEQLLVLSERYASVSWVLVSDDLTDQFLRMAVYGSRRFSIVFKELPLDEIREALRAASRGERYICQRATETLLARQASEASSVRLTATEIEIVKAITQGRTTKEIAAERFLSIHTVNTHRKNIFRKLNVNTAHEAVKYALRAGWVDPSEFYI